MAFVVLRSDADTGVLPESWLSASEDEIRAEAGMHHGACDDGDLDPADLEWRLVVDLPLAVLMPLMDDVEGWRSWFDAELAMMDEEHPHRADAYRSLMEEPLETPIVVTIERNRVQIWDGWHRTATRIVGDAMTIPAIVGIMPDCETLLDLVASHAGQGGRSAYGMHAPPVDHA